MPDEQSTTITKCYVCKKLIPQHKKSMRLCNACSISEQNRFSLVRDFLSSNGTASVITVSQETGVSTADVRKFMDMGRLITLKSDLNKATNNTTCE